MISIDGYVLEEKVLPSQKAARRRFDGTSWRDVLARIDVCDDGRPMMCCSSPLRGAQQRLRLPVLMDTPVMMANSIPTCREHR
jgi:hypothetical protein